MLKSDFKIVFGFKAIKIKIHGPNKQSDISNNHISNFLNHCEVKSKTNGLARNVLLTQVQGFYETLMYICFALNSRAIGKVQTRISQLRDFTRSCGKTSVWIEGQAGITYGLFPDQIHVDATLEYCKRSPFHHMYIVTRRIKPIALII